MSGIRREGANDAAGDIGRGHTVLGTSPTNNYTNVTATITGGSVKHKGAVNTQTVCGVAVRFTLNNGGGNNTPNCLMLVARAKRRNDGKYKVIFSLYKMTGTGATSTVTKIKDLDQIDGRTTPITDMTLVVDTSGNWDASLRTLSHGFPYLLRKSGTDSALATAGALETGRVALYSYIQSDNTSYAFTEIGSISGSAAASTPVQADVIRGDGTGRITYEGAGAYSDDDAGGDEVQVPSVVGGRLWLPPGTGELVSIIRRGDSAVEPDTGFADNNDLTLTHRAAWATLSDALFQSYEQLIVSDGPSLYWTLDGVTGATDLSGNGRDGTANGGISIGAFADSPILGGVTCTDFDGSDDRIYGTSYTPCTNGTARTWEGWAYRDTATGYHNLVGGQSSECMQFFIVTGTAQMYFNADRGSAATDLGNIWPGTAQWVHWAVTFDESTNALVVYMNGAAVFTGTHANPYDATPGHFVLGAEIAATNCFNGKMAHVAVYERALTPTEILAHYNKGIGG